LDTPRKDVGPSGTWTSSIRTSFFLKRMILRTTMWEDVLFTDLFLKFLSMIIQSWRRFISYFFTNTKGSNTLLLEGGSKSINKLTDNNIIIKFYNIW